MQLVAYGAQDIYLTGNPQITFFKVVYRRHTNFSMEAIEQTINGTVALGGRVSTTISRNGDLVHRMYVEMDVTAAAVGDPSTGLWTNDSMFPINIGYSTLKQVEIEIGGQLIDRQLSQWMSVWDELTNPEYKAHVLTLDAADDNSFDESLLRYAPNAYQAMIGGFQCGSTTALTLNLPLRFWFCRNPGLALPLIALQYHEVKLHFDFEASRSGGVTANPANFTLWVDYIYLDTDERRRFAQVSHEYLIEQVQHQQVSCQTPGTESKIDLTFNHPVKELIWAADNTVTHPTEFTSIHEIGGLRTNATAAGGGSAQLRLNGHDRFAARDMQYFTRVQPYQHHTNMPLGGRIGVYSFSLKPEEHQPSGTCNFSRIDNAQLTLNAGTTVTGTDLATAHNWHIFAVNYNVLRIMSGMGGLAYSN